MPEKSPAPGEAEARSLSLALGEIRASIQTPAGPSSGGARTVNLIWTTGAGVKRMDWASGKVFIEELSTDPSAVRMDRLRNGANLLDAHWSMSVRNILGVVETADLVDGKGTASVRFSERDDVEPIYQDVVAGIIRSVSVGYKVLRFEDTGRVEDGFPVWRAVDWEPCEISLVPVGADPGCGVQRADRAAPDGGKPTVYPATIQIRKDTMPNITPAPEGGAAPNVDPAASRAAPPPAAATPPAADPVQAERARAGAIRSAVRKAGLAETLADELCDAGVSIDAARERVIDEIAARAAAGLSGAPSHGRVEVGTDNTDPAAIRAHMADAIAARTAARIGLSGAVPMTDGARAYADLSILDMGRELMGARGERLGRLSPAALYERLGERSMSTSDFPALLSSAANKVLLPSYQAAAATFERVSTRKTVRDFKPVSFIRLGDFPTLTEVDETAEYKMGTVSESAETLTLASWGRILQLSRRMLVNDDLGGFGDLAQKAGIRVRAFQNALFYSMLLQNNGFGPTMSDGKPLFHVDHGNVGTAAAISTAAIGEGQAAMMLQKSLDGVALNIAPDTLLTGPMQMTTAAQVLYSVVATEAKNAPVFADKIAAVGDANLHPKPKAWWLMAGPAKGGDALLHAYLEGLDGPRVATKDGWRTDGVELKVSLDFAVGAIDWRSIFLNPGQ